MKTEVIDKVIGGDAQRMPSVIVKGTRFSIDLNNHQLIQWFDQDNVIRIADLKLVNDGFLLMYDPLTRNTFKGSAAEKATRTDLWLIKLPPRSRLDPYWWEKNAAFKGEYLEIHPATQEAVLKSGADSTPQTIRITDKDLELAEELGVIKPKHNPFALYREPIVLEDIRERDPGLLPVIAVQGTLFQINIERLRLEEVDNPVNRIDLETVDRSGEDFLFWYDAQTKNLFDGDWREMLARKDVTFCKLSGCFRFDKERDAHVYLRRPDAEPVANALHSRRYKH